MRFFLYDYDEVAGYPASRRGITLSIYRKLQTFHDAGRYFKQNHILAHYSPFAVTVFAFRSNNLAFTLTSRAGGGGIHLSQEIIGYMPYLAAALTGGTLLN